MAGVIAEATAPCVWLCVQGGVCTGLCPAPAMMMSVTGRADVILWNLSMACGMLLFECGKSDGASSGFARRGTARNCACESFIKLYCTGCQSTQAMLIEDIL